jgi:adenylate cyclase
VLRIAAVVAACMGRHEESVALLRRAVTLDPLSVPAQRVLGLRCLYVGALDEAQVALDKALELNPDGEFTRYWRGMLLLARGRPQEARSTILREGNEVLRMLGLCVVERALGNVDEANIALQSLVDTHADRGAFQIAAGYAYLGDVDRAFAWLERADLQRDPGLVEIKAEMLLRNIHRDPRWPSFLTKLGLPQ